MKIFKYIALSILALSLIGCGQSKTVDGRTYEPYGLVNKTRVSSECIAYEVSLGSAVLGIILFETVIAPIYVFGWDIMEPKYNIEGCVEEPRKYTPL